MSKYTEGPWVIAKRNLTHGEHEVLIKQANGTHFPTWIADIAESGNQLDNAQLIAAAPDLLVACKEAQYQLQGMDSACVMILNDAIKKAEGGG